jgi:hypothetical protein
MIFLNSSCKKSSELPTQPASADFPNTVGDYWSYAFYDSLSNKSDILTISIVGQTLDKSISIWQFKYSDRIDTQYVSISGDTVTFSPQISSPWSSYNTKIIFPLIVGNGWRTYFDTTFISSTNYIGVPAGSFPTAYRIDEIWGGFNDYGTIVSWFVPKVGFVSRYHRGTSFGTANESFNLISYIAN